MPFIIKNNFFEKLFSDIYLEISVRVEKLIIMITTVIVALVYNLSVMFYCKQENHDDFLPCQHPFVLVLTKILNVFTMLGLFSVLWKLIRKDLTEVDLGLFYKSAIK